MNNLKIFRSAGKALLILGITLSATVAHATNGTFMTGYGFQAASMGGTSIGLPQDSLAAANNPAGMAYVGNRVDFDMAIFDGFADASFGQASNKLSMHMLLPAPEGGFNYQISPEITFGVSMYGMGARSDYGRPFLSVPGAGPAKSALTQLNILPTVTYKVLPNLALGFSFVGGFEQFRANGLIASTPNGSLVGIPSHGNSNALGYGVGMGVTWKPLTNATVGASYYSKMKYGSLSGYDKDILAADGGRIDGAQHYGVGFSYKPTEALTIGFDWLHIDWNTVKLFSDPATFGWHNQNVFRVGASYEMGSKWVLMAGYSHSNEHVDTDHVLANLSAPTTLDRAVTIGATYHLDKNNDLSLGFEHDIPHAMAGTGPSTGTNLNVKYDFVRFSYAHRF